MTKQEKIEQAQARIKVSQEKDELKYNWTYDKNFHDALFIALNMEIGKAYVFLNSDYWNQPYTITKRNKRIFIAEMEGRFHILNFQQATNQIKGERPVMVGEMFSTKREEDLNMMLFNFKRYRGKYKGLEINENDVLTAGGKNVRRYFGKGENKSTHFSFQWAKFPLDNRYYFSTHCNMGNGGGGGGPLTFNAYDMSFKTESECITYCINDLIKDFSKETKYQFVTKYLNELLDYLKMGIEIEHITGDLYEDAEIMPFEVIGKGKNLLKIEVDENESDEESEEIEVYENQLALF